MLCQLRQVRVTVSREDKFQDADEGVRLWDVYRVVVVVVVSVASILPSLWGRVAKQPAITLGYLEVAGPCQQIKSASE